MIALPAPIACTNPVPSTSAALILSERHLKLATPGNKEPSERLTTPNNCTMSVGLSTLPTGTTATLVTVTPVGGGAATVKLPNPVLPAAIALIVTEPELTPVANPLAFTVATTELELNQVNTWPGITLPFWSLAMAVN